MKYFFIKKILVLEIFLKIIISIILYLFLVNKTLKINNKMPDVADYKFRLDKKVDYIHYESKLITEKMKNDAGWQLEYEQAAFINGIIRKHKPKNLLEIGVARGGSSVLILNAIKDFPESRLVSIDLKADFYQNTSLKTGYLVKEKFPELMNKWNLFVGQMPYIILSKINIKFDFFFLDTAHTKPGELINLIEALPFLNENAIIILHDIIWHLKKELKSKEISIKPTQIYLMSALVGEKIIPLNSDNNIQNIGVVFLDKNKERHYLSYFLLLMTTWEYLPNDEQLNGLRSFIKKYYENKLYLKIFDDSVSFNKQFFKKYGKIKNRKIL